VIPSKGIDDGHKGRNRGTEASISLERMIDHPDGNTGSRLPRDTSIGIEQISIIIRPSSNYPRQERM
jgi:hypothetical protein